MLNQSAASNVRRAWGYQVGSASCQILHYLSDHPKNRVSARECAALFSLNVESVEKTLSDGMKAGALTRHKEGRQSLFSFNAIQKPKPVNFKSPGTGVSIARPSIGKQAELLEVRQRINGKTERKSSDNTPAIPGEHTKVTKAPTYAGLGNRAYFDPATAPSIFRLIPLGATLEAA